MLYFAYGSNMSLQRIRSRVPSANVVSTATLPRHQLRFHKLGMDGSGKCDSYQTNDDSHRVIGVLYQISPSDKPALDRREGLGYDEKTVAVKLAHGNTLHASTYYATDIVAGLPPYNWYKYHVLTGARENGLPPDYLASIEAVDAVVDHDRRRYAFEMAIYFC